MSKLRSILIPVLVFINISALLVTTVMLAQISKEPIVVGLPFGIFLCSYFLGVLIEGEKK